jgi:hypothetical protein
MAGHMRNWAHRNAQRAHTHRETILLPSSLLQKSPTSKIPYFKYFLPAIKITYPIANNAIIDKIENELLPVKFFTTAYKNGPNTAANFPKISKNPKYSPERCGGTNFPK